MSDAKAILLCSILLLIAARSSSTSFSFSLAPPFRDELGSSELVFTGEARRGANDEFIELHRQAFIVTGRAYYADLVEFKPSGASKPYSFHTVFTFQIVESTGLEKNGGLAFLISPSADPPPEFSYGTFLGLTNASGTNESLFFAVEFDTWGDDGVRDPRGTHLGVDINSAQSAKVSLLPNSTFSRNSTWQAWIDYDSPSENL